MLLLAAFDLIADQEFQYIICQKQHEYDMNTVVVTPVVLLTEAPQKFNALNHGGHCLLDGQNLP